MTSSWIDDVLAAMLANAAMATVLAVVVFVTTRRLRHPAVAHFLWLLVLVKLVTPPLVPVRVSGWIERLGLGADPPGVQGTAIEPSRAPVEIAFPAPGLASPPAGPPGAEMLDPSAPLRALVASSSTAPVTAGATLAGLWIGGAVALLALAAVRTLQFDRLLRRARPAPDAVAIVAGEVARRFGMARAPAVLVIDARIPPLLWAPWGAARIVLPADLAGALDRDQLATLLAHELAHLRRRDHWRRWPELVVGALYWWHPVAWWARRELRRAEEQCCDAWVQQKLSLNLRDYARALFVTVDFLARGRLAVPRTASSLGEGKLLQRRFEMILHTPMTPRLSRSLLAALLFTGAAVLPWAPAGALGPDGDPDDVAQPGESGQPGEDAAPGLADAPAVPAAEAGIPGLPLSPDRAPGTGAPVPAARSPQASTDPNADIQARLARLEEQIALLLAELRQLQADATIVPGAGGMSGGFGTGFGSTFRPARARSPYGPLRARTRDTAGGGSSSVAPQPDPGEAAARGAYAPATPGAGALPGTPAQPFPGAPRPRASSSADSPGLTPPAAAPAKEDLRAEKARLRARLKEIEDLEAAQGSRSGRLPGEASRN